MRIIISKFILVAVLAISIFSCREEEFYKYDRPEWLSGKLYSQVEATEGLDSFAVCLKKSGVDTIINVSGSFTVFAPVNEAFREFFRESPQYNKISDIPAGELEKIVRYHIIQNSWTIPQLSALDVYGWIDPDDPNNNKPRGYKRQTLLQETNRKYPVTIKRGVYSITDSLSSNLTRTVFTPSRKYVPLFFDRFLGVAGLSGSDYDFYFQPGYSVGKMHYAGARIVSPEIYAENGIAYKIDKVILPLGNAEKILSREYPGHSYSDFLKMVYRYGQISPNMQETQKLPGFRQGLAVDTLYNLTFPELTFNIHSELTNPPNTPATFSIRYHNGLVAPTNQALEELFNKVITGPGRWPNLNAVPDDIYKIIVKSHMSASPVYQKDFTRGFINGENDLVFIDPSTVVQAEYASNATFSGVNKPVVPRAFSSVTGPVYLNPGYSIFRTALERTKVIATLKRKNENYQFFIIPDNTLGIDSSLFLIPDLRNPDNFQFVTWDKSSERYIYRTTDELVTQLFNQVGITQPTGSGRKEFIPNLAGNYIVFDWENDDVSGGASSTYGFMGDSVITLAPRLLEQVDNGLVYEVNGWFNFPQANMYATTGRYSEFTKLIEQAGLRSNLYQRLNFISPGEKYTVFIPSDEALRNYDTSNMTKEELTQFIKYHFVRGDIVFTDGKKPKGAYPTMRVDESSTVYNRKYSPLILNPGVDKIDIMNPDGSLYYRINEKNNTTNTMVAEDTDTSPLSFKYITVGVVHVIDTVLVKYNK
jgi:uncharacterized surface protein with fasciclin (FAS1) repeats